MPETCCGERADRTCRSCRRRVCRFCMATRYICSRCQWNKRDKTQAALERSLRAVSDRLRSLLFKCVDHRNDVVHSEPHLDKAKRLYEAVQAANNVVVEYLTAKRCTRCSRIITEPQIRGDELCPRCADPLTALPDVYL